MSSHVENGVTLFCQKLGQVFFELESSVVGSDSDSHVLSSAVVRPAEA